jgi:predicted NBD/HSP70 family sugar kinase
VDSYAYQLGRGLAAIASVWDPELLVVGGVISPYFAMLSAGIERAFDDWASPAGRRVPRVAARLGTDAGVLGALCLADEQTRRPQ